MTRRLYLDTADLLEIGDGRVAAGLLANLVGAMSDADTRLVLSRDHVHDVSRGGSTGLESLVRSVKSFGSVLVVMEGPDEVEPLTADRPDIVLAPCRNFRELAFSDAARGPIDRVNFAYDRVHAGDRAGYDVLSSGPGSFRASKRANDLYQRCFVSLCLSGNGDAPEAVLAVWEDKLEVRVTQHEREAVLAHLQRARAMMEEVAPVVAKESVDVASALRQTAIWESAPDTWPGHSLAYRVSVNRRLNGSRKPKRSDLLDFDHVKHFPYVDIATCDGGTLHALRAVQWPAGPRAPAVLQNRKLEPLIDALRAGPRRT